MDYTESGRELEEGMEQDLAQEGDDLEYASSSPPSSTQTSTLTWIQWFTSLPGHDYYCEVHEDFIEDDFNLTGLQSQVPFWKEALEMVLDVEPEEDSLTIPDISIIESSAELLYGLVHQRFILTKVGLHAMVEKYEVAGFGACPRVFCHSTPVIPCGRSDAPGLDTVKLFCPNCGDIYGPPSSKYSNVDGAFFGTSFPTLFFQTYPEMLAVPFCPSTPPRSATTPSTTASNLPDGETSGTGSASAQSEAVNANDAETSGPGAASTSTAAATTATQAIPGGTTVVNPNPHGGQRPALAKVYVPRIYGFKVSERARSGPRMAWLRERPETAEELENVDWRGRWVGGGGGGNGGDGPSGPDDGAGPSGSGGGGGKLFDDDDEDKDDEESEEEEEDAAGGAGAGANGGGTAGGTAVKVAASGVAVAGESSFTGSRNLQQLQHQQLLYPSSNASSLSQPQQTKSSRTFHLPSSSKTNSPPHISKYLQPVPSSSRHFLPHANPNQYLHHSASSSSSRSRRRNLVTGGNVLYSETETEESELETPGSGSGGGMKRNFSTDTGSGSVSHSYTLALGGKRKFVNDSGLLLKRGDGSGKEKNVMKFVGEEMMSCEEEEV